MNVVMLNISLFYFQSEIFQVNNEVYFWKYHGYGQISFDKEP